jgi:hypothetical protein
MKKIIISSLVASSLLLSNLYADKETVFVGGTLGGGSGTVSITDSNTAVTFTDSSDITSSDAKIYIGYGQIYGFMQTGTLKPKTQYLNDLDYTAYGVGFLRKANFWKMDLKVVNIVPEFDAEIAYDSVTGNNFKDASGLLISIDAGLGFSIPKFENLELVAGVGYDIHVVNNSDSTDNNGYVSGSWNMTSLNVNFGARYNF